MMKPYIREENGFFVVCEQREYQSRVVVVPLLKTRRKSEAELMINYLGT